VCGSAAQCPGERMEACMLSVPNRDAFTAERERAQPRQTLPMGKDRHLGNQSRSRNASIQN